EHVEELREGLPPPLDARLHRLEGNVLGALQIADHEVTVFLGAGREGEAAVAHDHGGDAVPAGAGPQGIPEDLGVHVGMAIHEAGRHHLTFGVQHLLGRFTYATDGGDLAPLDAHICAISRTSGPVHHPAVLDQEVKGHRSAPLRCRGAPLDRGVMVLHPALPPPATFSGTLAARWPSGSSIISTAGTCPCTSTTRAGCACWRSTTRRASTRITW